MCGREITRDRDVTEMERGINASRDIWRQNGGVYIPLRMERHILCTLKGVVPTKIKMLGLDWVLTLGGRF